MNESLDLGSVEMQSSIIPNFKCSLVSYTGHHFQGGGVLSLCREYSQNILSLTDRVKGYLTVAIIKRLDLKDIRKQDN